MDVDAWMDKVHCNVSLGRDTQMNRFQYTQWYKHKETQDML